LGDVGIAVGSIAGGGEKNECAFLRFFISKNYIFEAPTINLSTFTHRSFSEGGHQPFNHIMTFQEYRRHDALALAELVKKGDISPSELLEIAIQRAEAVNPTINAISFKMYDTARQMAKAVAKDAPFAGVPFLIKELGIHVKNTPQRRGSKGYEKYVSTEDGYLAQKLRSAGFTFLGKSNTPEFGLTPYTEPEAYGATGNPWNPQRSAGGSSGGAGAGVAAGIVPIATASDGGGSIRIPASCNGLFGLKPSRGRVSLGPQSGEWWSGATVEGCVSRSVRDTAAYLDWVSGSAPGELYLIQQPERPYLEEIRITPKSLKIGFSTQHTLGQTMDAECVKAVEKAAKLLENLGHSVEEVPLPYRREDLTEVFLMMVFGECAADLDILSQFLGRKVRPSDVETTTYALGLLGNAFTAKEFAVQKRRWNDLARRMGAFHEAYDLLLTPTVSMPPFPIGALEPSAAELSALKVINRLGLSSVLKKMVAPLAEKTFAYIPHTAITNMTGQPAMSVPLHWTSDNLPVGVMFAAAIGREDLLLQLAGQLEEAEPWFERVAEL
jgi:amidase